MEFIIILIMLGFIYLLLKPKPKAKSKEYKQEEILQEYKGKLDYELAGIEDKDLLKQKKTALLKSFANELNRNIFFDVDETKALIQELVSYEIRK